MNYNAEYRIIACYYRVSRYTGACDESKSIKNQRLIVDRYIRENLSEYYIVEKNIEEEIIREKEEKIKDKIKEKIKDKIVGAIEENRTIREKKREYIIKEYIDDGYSGKNINRPALEELLEDVAHNKISVIIVKDFSRFSRDYLFMGEFLERINYSSDIRFISINDNYDNYDSIIINKSDNFEHINCKASTVDEAFKHIIYDYYSIDNSYKIKKGLENSRSRGRYIAAKAIYGYRKKNGKLIVDKEEARIVQSIFKDYLNGVKVVDIVKKLNKTSDIGHIRKIKNINNINGYYCEIKVGEVNNAIKWDKSKVYRILREEQYTGIMIYGKKQTKEIGTNKKIIMPRKLWKIIENHHQAIIDKELFQQVREKMSSKYLKRG